VGVLIDTSVLIALERGSEEVRERLAAEPEESAAVSAVTASELLHGVHRADSAVRRGGREDLVEAILATARVLPFDLEVARVHARLWADLAARGEVIGPHDMLIAATALHHRLRVLTHDLRHFGRVEGLAIERVGTAIDSGS
jgi:tRNA(fMet)-specific endonuclease VapC